MSELRNSLRWTGLWLISLFWKWQSLNSFLIENGWYYIGCGKYER